MEWGRETSSLARGADHGKSLAHETRAEVDEIDRRAKSERRAQSGLPRTRGTGLTHYTGPLP